MRGEECKCVDGLSIYTCELSSMSPLSKQTNKLLKLINDIFSFIFSFVHRVYIEGNHHYKNEKE